MPIPALNTDSLIFATIALVVVYGVVAGQMGVMRLAISTYVGLVLAATFAKPIFDATNQGNFGGTVVSITIVQLVLFIVPVVLLQLGHHGHHVRMKGSKIVALVMAVLTALLLVSSTFSQLDATTLKSVIDGSNIASWIYDFRLWWLGLVPVGIAAEVFFRPKPRHH